MCIWTVWSKHLKESMVLASNSHTESASSFEFEDSDRLTDSCNSGKGVSLLDVLYVSKQKEAVLFNHGHGGKLAHQQCSSSESKDSDRLTDSCNSGKVVSLLDVLHAP